MLPLKIIPMILTQMIDALLQPLFWVVVAFVAYQHWRLQKMQIDMFGEASHTVTQIITHAVGYGLMGGVAGSLLLVIAGIPVNNLGIEYIWPVAILLTLVHIRYLCFAYAGGLISTVSVLFGWPEVHVPGLIALVAILHITESALIAISGRSGSAPLIMRTKQGDLVGGFHLQNFWPLPLVLLWSDMQIDGIGHITEHAYINMPSWWPIFVAGQQIPPDHVLVYTTITIIAALGYADRAVATHPELRRRQSAKHLFLYSFSLLLIAIASQTYPILQIIAAIYAPIGHECLIWLDNQQEQKGKPLFRPSPDGVMVLDVLPGSMAKSFGLKSGDIIQKINGMHVYRRMDIAEALRNGGNYVTIQFKRVTVIQQSSGTFSKGTRLGAITVPEGYETYYVDVGQDGAFAVLKRLWKRVRHRR